MLSPEDKKLQWVQQNRGPRKPRELRASEHLAHLTALVEKKASESGAVEVVELLADVVDDEFRRYCRVVSCKGGRLVIAVAQPSLRFAMRAKWSSILSHVLGKSRQFRAITCVDFQLGKVGVCVPTNVEP